ncbi:hypothetical protein D4S68_17245 [Salmonella enterica]|uniref:Uncharacterized protein n=6 Tax=Salmonella enterica TaxID=28901 RepID=A0A701FJY9_SALEN|nr:hypothetical protein C1D15_14410 [Salmonella enterica subsp. enterica serovar Kentucky]AWE46142.1 hypothetical protein A9G52_14360 [Salmonella enterica subsp. enterica serovar Worthington]AYJ55049.1 hypothetical protein D8S86_14855 [Salmonella enterica subsp. enterica serovar Mbandaka]AYJ64332.1 hypothetical protein D8S90_14865 [Salmonella enterica subsp. enterica serovar Lubbock]EAA0439674.1 hypothetical protein [Salmonella enterica]EAA0692320.1 hypothetical protein [Salmonella enterica su
MNVGSTYRSEISTTTCSEWWRLRYIVTDSASGRCFRSDMSLSQEGALFGDQPHISLFKHLFQHTVQPFFLGFCTVTV